MNIVSSAIFPMKNSAAATEMRLSRVTACWLAVILMLLSSPGRGLLPTVTLVMSHGKCVNVTRCVMCDGIVTNS